MARVAVSSRPAVQKYFNFTGASPRVEVNSDAGLLITSDIDIRVLFQRSSSTHFGALLTRLGFTGSTYGFYFAIDNQASNRLNYRWSPTGVSANLVSKTTSAFVPLPLNTPTWLRVTHDVDNGSGSNDVTFYWGAHTGTSAEPTTWNQIGAVQNTAGTTSIFNPTGQGVAVGAFGSGGFGSLPGGRIHRGLVKNGINGTTIVDIDASRVGFLSSSVFIEPAGFRAGIMSGGVSHTKSRSTASGRVSGV